MLTFVNYNQSFIQGSGIDNSGRECWSNCNKSNGKCSWCGSKGVCCRKGVRVVGTECDGEIGGDGHHRCVAESGMYVLAVAEMQFFCPNILWPSKPHCKCLQGSFPLKDMGVPCDSYSLFL